MITLLRLTPYTDATVVPSPNHGARKAPAIQGIVLHASADEGNEAGTLTWLRSPKSRVSCHLLVSRTGAVTRLVGDQQRAWHAGLAWWRGTNDVNSITLGVEIANRNDGEPYTEAQYSRVAEIVVHYCRQGLSLDDVVSHGAIAEDRRTDPFGWDWERFRAIVQERLRAAEVEERLKTHDRRSRWIEAARRQQLPTIPAPKTQLPPLAAPKQVPSLPRPTQTPPIVAPKQLPALAPPRQVPALTAKQQGSPLAPAKKPLFSRTLWLNGLTVLAAGSVIIGEALDLAFSVGLSLPREITMWALFSMGMVNILLRFQTTCPIGCDHGDGAPAEATKPLPARNPAYDNTGKAAPGAR